MKNIIQLLILCLFCQSTIAQVKSMEEINTDIKQIPEQSEVLKLLYDQGAYLENNGTPWEIEQNRLSIKNEWAKISPETADRYKPIAAALTDEEQKLFTPQRNIPHANTSPSNRSWGDDLLVHQGLISGVDMEVSASGDIYLLGYYNDLNIAVGCSIYIYRSTDNGASFSLWDQVTVPGVDYDKMQLVLLEPDQYLNVYVVTTTQVFGVYRWDLNTQDLDFQIISAGVSDFAVDRNFPNNTNNVRVFATFLKPNGGGCETRVHSARSTAGSFGFDWVDETLITTVCSKDIDFAYGLSGATYTSFISMDTGNMYVQNNSNYNDPATWSDIETITDGDDIEAREPKIKATRKPFSSDEVLLFASTREEGSTDDFNLAVYKRENANPFAEFETIGISNNGTSIRYTDAWIRKESGAEVIRLSHITTADGGVSRTLKVRTYDGTSVSSAETISDDDNVYSVGAIAEIAIDQSPCLAFSNPEFIDAENIYFDSDAILKVEDANFTNFQYYPNPTTEILTIEAAQVIEKVELYTTSGKKVKEFTPNTVKVDLRVQDLSSGIYIVKIHSDKQTSNFKLIKN